MHFWAIGPISAAAFLVIPALLPRNKLIRAMEDRFKVWCEYYSYLCTKNNRSEPSFFLLSMVLPASKSSCSNSCPESLTNRPMIPIKNHKIRPASRVVRQKWVRKNRRDVFLIVPMIDFTIGRPLGPFRSGYLHSSPRINFPNNLRLRWKGRC